MAKHANRKATTLSISLSRELAQAVDRRVKSGLYTSASELVREALRLLLRSEPGERARPADRDQPTKAEQRLATADLAETGAALRAGKRRRSGSSFVGEPSPEGLDATTAEQEVGKGLRLAPERLQRLTLHE